MSAPARRLCGQPLVVLGALLLGWTGARVTSFSDGGPNLPKAVLTVGTAAYYVGPLSYPSQAYPAQVNPARP